MPTAEAACELALLFLSKPVVQLAQHVFISFAGLQIVDCVFLHADTIKPFWVYVNTLFYD